MVTPARVQSIIQRNRKIILMAKDRPCMDCGGRFPSVAMDFDHVEGDKIAHVGAMTTASVDRLLAEIEKCEVVCANCHRVRTALRSGWS